MAVVARVCRAMAGEGWVARVCPVESQEDAAPEMPRCSQQLECEPYLQVLTRLGHLYETKNNSSYRMNWSLEEIFFLTHTNSFEVEFP